MGNFWWSDTDGLRNEEPLTEEQIELSKIYAVSLEVRVDRIEFGKGATGYLSGINVLTIGPDVLPLAERSKNPNSNISLKGSIAHEIVGHRDAEFRGWTQPDDLLEEVQASIRAARFAPDLSRQERFDLIRDAIHRLNKRGKSIRDVKSKLHIKER